MERLEKRTIGVYAGALGYSYNADFMKRKGGAEPKCWADLLDPRFKDEVQVADPNASGTSYTMLATLVQLMGEDKAFDYLKKLHQNINQYTKSGAAPAKAASLGEIAVGITFQHDAVVMAVQGAPVKIVSPCEGTGYEIGSMSIIKGARNLDNAKKWYDWALTAAAQSARAEGQRLLSGAVEQGRALPAGEVAKARRDQADQLRLRQIRLVGGAPAPAVQMGQRGEERCRSSAPCRRAARLGLRDEPRRRRSRSGGSALPLLPWHLVPGEWYELFSATAPAVRACWLALTGRAWWLAPISCRCWRRHVAAARPLPQGTGGALAGRRGILGLALIVAQGFAIGLRGWRWSLGAACSARRDRARPAWALARR